LTIFADIWIGLTDGLKKEFGFIVIRIAESIDQFQVEGGCRRSIDPVTERFEGRESVGELPDQEKHLSRCGFMSLSNRKKRIGKDDSVSLLSRDFQGFSSSIDLFGLCIGVESDIICGTSTWRRRC